MEKEFLDNSKPTRNVATGALEELMTNQTIMLGELRAQLEALQVRPSGGMIPNLADDIAIAEQIVCSLTMNTSVWPVGAFLAAAEGDMQS